MILQKALQDGIFVLTDSVWLVLIVVLALVAFGFIPRSGRIAPVLRWFDQTLPRLFLLAFLLRLVPVIVPKAAGFDIESYLLAGQSVLAGEGAYTSASVGGRYPYFPLTLYVWAGSVSLADLTGLPFVFIVRLPIILADSLLAILLYRIDAGRQEVKPYSSGLLYAVSPVAVLVSAYHGQFDTMVLLALVASLWVAAQTPAVGPALKAGLLIGVAICFKAWAVIFIPYAALRQRFPPLFTSYLLATFLVVAGISGLYLAFFPDQLPGMVSAVAGYRSSYGNWGFSFLLSLAAGLLPALRGLNDLESSYGFLVLGASLLASTIFFLRAKWSWPRASLGLVLVFMVFSNAFVLQYAIWLVPFAILADRRRKLAVYTASALVWLLPWYFLWHIFAVLPVVLEASAAQTASKVLVSLGLAPWAVACWWLISEILDSLHERRFSSMIPPTSRTPD